MWRCELKGWASPNQFYHTVSVALFLCPQTAVCVRVMQDNSDYKRLLPALIRCCVKQWTVHGFSLHRFSQNVPVLYLVACLMLYGKHNVVYNLFLCQCHFIIITKPSVGLKDRIQYVLLYINTFSMVSTSFSLFHLMCSNLCFSVMKCLHFPLPILWRFSWTHNLYKRTPASFFCSFTKSWTF